MFSATTHGRPRRLTASTSRRLRRRLVASTTQTTRSGRFSPTRAAVQHVAGDALVGRARMQAVGARQVEHAQRLAGGGVQPAFLALDGDAGVVGDLLAAAGQQVEQRGLAAVRVADQRHQRAAAVDVDRRLCSCVGRLCTRDAGGLGAAQREGRRADAHDQRIAAAAAARHQHDLFAGEEADLVEPVRPFWCRRGAGHSAHDATLPMRVWSSVNEVERLGTMLGAGGQSCRGAERQ